MNNTSLGFSPLNGGRTTTKRTRDIESSIAEVVMLLLVSVWASSLFVASSLVQGTNALSAHIEGKVAQAVDYAKDQVVTAWDPNNADSHVMDGFEFSQGQLRLPMDGRYYVYFQLYFSPSLQKNPNRVAMFAGNRLLLMIQKGMEAHAAETGYAGGVFQLKAGDMIYVKVLGYGAKMWIGPNHSYFGAYMSSKVGTPVNGGWSDFGKWSECSVSCGNGIQERSRTCTNPPPAHGGKECTGNNRETRECAAGSCVVDGGFTQWSKFSECSRTCGIGKKTRKRECTNPPPSGGGKRCKGKYAETKKCKIRSCKVLRHSFENRSEDIYLCNYQET